MMDFEETGTHDPEVLCNQRQLASNTTESSEAVQPEAVHSSTVREGWVSAVKVPTC